ncbi:MAG: MBL fold metallo-hydrolase [Hyphomicrobiaceae bacterium]|nr:MAG: MBL fold metallo-hydrolase [Hyphomicrobiaceae bacterium]
MPCRGRRHQAEIGTNRRDCLMRVTLLGTGAPLSPTRNTTGLIVSAPGCEPLLIDTCGGFEVARAIVGAGFKLTDIGNVVLTHRHFDHIGGMMALYLANQPLNVMASADTLEAVAAVKAAAFPEWPLHSGVRHVEVRSGQRTEVGGFTLELIAVEHRVPTLALRLAANGRSIGFSADTLPCSALDAVARDADLFICDAICAEADGEIAATKAKQLMHPNAREAGEAARRGGAGKLVCVHIGRFGSPEKIHEEAARAFAGPVQVPDDGTVIEV